MTSIIRAWGNSQGLYIPKSILRQLNMSISDRVIVTVEDGRIVIRKDDETDSRAKAYEDLKRIRMEASAGRSDSSRDYRREYEEYLDERYSR